MTKEEQKQYMKIAEGHLASLKIHSYNAAQDVEAFRGPLEEEGMFSEQLKVIILAVFSDLSDSAASVERYSSKVIAIMESIRDENDREDFTAEEQALVDQANKELAFCQKAHKEAGDIVFGEQNSDGRIRVYRFEEALEQKAISEAEGDEPMVKRFERLAEREKAAYDSFYRRVRMQN